MITNNTCGAHLCTVTPRIYLFMYIHYWGVVFRNQEGVSIVVEALDESVHYMLRMIPKGHSK